VSGGAGDHGDQQHQANLCEVATSTLERLREAVAGDRLEVPVTRAGLLGLGIRNQLETLEGALAGHSALACRTVLDVVLAERRANARPAPELVWSGPERTNSTARDTAVVLRALFERARRQVILAGYDFRKGSSLLKPLWIAMRDRGVDARFFVHIAQPDESPADPRAYANQAVQAIMGAAWTFGDPRPRVYYDARAVAPLPKFNMHAKCVVVDGECALVTSANFTRNAYEQNTECGVLLESPAFAHHLARQWLGLAETGLAIEAGE
jgi:phosphatidylserine/phosphatidylglycerophosphate/cardiolipin synthase-like enzyme